MSEDFLKCQLGFLGNTEGSAYLSQGKLFNDFCCLYLEYLLYI